MGDSRGRAHRAQGPPRSVLNLPTGHGVGGWATVDTLLTNRRDRPATGRTEC